MIAPGSLALCINDTFHEKAIELIPNRPVKGKHYFIREIEEYYGAGKVGVRLEEISNPLIQFSHGVLKEPSFDLERFSFEDDIDLTEVLEECLVGEEDLVI
jgi:hypothetical protein